MSKLQQPVIGYTLGDQAGIGPEMMQLALRALKPLPVKVVCMGKRVKCPPGVSSPETARMALEHLEHAAQALNSGEIDAVVTAPVCKQSLKSVGFAYPGQTEFFADRLGCKVYAMCLSGEKLTVALCTTHVALAEVPHLLNSERVASVSALLAQHLKRMGKECPRIALAGLNPHNGEGGAFGDEETRIMAPAVAQLNRAMPWAHFTGPCVPDVVYRDAAAGVFDAVVAPYHDQALIPLKLLDFDCAVNITLGLPRLRVSPDHGTAFSLAAKRDSSASPNSTIHAFRMALRYLNAL